MSKLLIGCLSLILSFFFIPSVNAQDTGWVIREFRSDIQIQKNGSVQIEEKISVEFGDLQRHGIYREIPYRYTNDDGSKTYTEITGIDTGVHQNKVEKQGDYIRIRIGDPDEYVTGSQSYTVAYTVRGVLRRFEHDELYWNVVGGNWPIPIENASATVSLPGVEITDITCFQGPVGSTASCVFEKTGDHSATFSTTGLLEPGSDLSVVIGYPSGMIDVPIVQSFASRLLSLGPVITLLITLILGVGIILWMWFYNGRDYIFRGKHLFDSTAKPKLPHLGYKPTIVVEYTPPEKLRPAEVGVLMDERADTLDVTSTIIDFATRGLLTISEIPKKWAFGKSDFELRKTKKLPTSLHIYEKKLFDELFQTADTVKVSELKKTFYDELIQVKKQLYADLVKKGYFPKSPETVKNIYLGIAIGIIGISIAGAIFSIGIESEYLFMGTLGLVVTGLNFLFVSRSMSRRTALGSEMYRRVKGYELFIGNVEKHRQKFFERKNMFNEVLPYAMVFGLTEKFAKGLEELGYKPESPTWYHGGIHFSPTRFGSQITQFSSSLGAAMVATPGGSGFSGGGGSSGGGFGGGGGGSW